MSSTEDIKIDALKSNEYYNNALSKVKENIKSKVLAMSSKDEQLQYIREEKNRYILLKETENTRLTIIIVVAVCALMSFILLNILKSNIIFFVLWLLAFTILIASIASAILLSVNGNRVKYTIFIMAYEEIENRIQNGKEVTNSESGIVKRLDSLKETVDVIDDQLRMIYALQKEANRKK